MYSQSELRDVLCSPLASIGATDTVTGTDLRRFADNLAKTLCYDGPDTEEVVRDPSCDVSEDVALAESDTEQESDGSGNDSQSQTDEQTAWDTTDEQTAETEG